MLLHYCVVPADSLDWACVAVIPAPWQTPESKHPDATEVHPGRYPHTDRGFFFAAITLARSHDRLPFGLLLRGALTLLRSFSRVQQQFPELAAFLEFRSEERRVGKECR